MPPRKPPANPLQLWTAGADYTGPDRVLLHQGQPDPGGALALTSLQSDVARAAHLGATPRQWEALVGRYRQQVLAVRRTRRAVWRKLVGMGTATLCCSCHVPDHCHRTWLARILVAEAGATYHGERSAGA